MRLLYIHKNSPLSETADNIQVLQMCRAFACNNIDVTLAIPCKTHQRKRIGEIVKNTLNEDPPFKLLYYPRISFRGKAKEIGGFLSVRRILSNADPYDLIYARSVIINYLAAKMGYKVIYESHASSLHSVRIINELYKWLTVKTAKLDNEILLIPISEALAKYWIGQAIPATKILTLHDGFYDKAYEHEINKSIARQLTNLPLDKKIVVYCGSLYKDRDISQVIRLSREYSESQFVVVGGPDFQKSIYEKRAIESGCNNIHFTGHVPHHRVQHYLFAADVLLMIWSWDVPTIRICSPLKLFEYMATGRIIVGQSFPTITEVLTNGVDAYLADPNSFDDLKNKLATALKVSYPSIIAQNARENAFAHYSWDRRAKAIINRLQEIENASII